MRGIISPSAAALLDEELLEEEMTSLDELSATELISDDITDEELTASLLEITTLDDETSFLGSAIQAVRTSNEAKDKAGLSRETLCIFFMVI